MQRREFLSTAIAMAAASTLPALRAEEITDGQPWEPGTVNLPTLPSVHQGGLAFFNQHEFETAEAIAERLIPTDALSMGGKEAGCATFIDRQLAGDYGKGATLYRLGRFVKGTFEQGTQSVLTPSERWRKGLIAIDAYSQAQFGNSFVRLQGEQQDQVLLSFEKSAVKVGEEFDDGAKEIFEQVLANVREGFLSDPIYGGNKGMVSWKMLGFPGARYDFRDVIARKGQKLNIIPTSLIDNTL